MRNSMMLIVDLFMVTLFAVAAVLVAGRGVTTGFVGAGIGMLAAETLRQLYRRRAVRAYFAGMLSRNSRLRDKASSALG